jgi:DNA recombination protein RmuC
MSGFSIAVLILFSACAGFLLGYLYFQKRISNLHSNILVLEEQIKTKAEKIVELQQFILQRDTEIKNLQDQISGINTRNAELQTTLSKEREFATEKLALLNEAKEKLSDTFKALSKDALDSSNQAFLELAGQAFKNLQTEAKGDLEQRKQAIDSLVKPLSDSLKNYNEEIQKMRISEGSLLDQVKSLQSETEILSRSLRMPQVRGRWGEYTLKRMVELAGMSEYCDFEEQKSVTGEEGAKLRPDMKIALPGNKLIVVDAKTPLSAYLEAMETNDEVTRNKKLKDHANNVRQQVRNLSSKSYWEQFEFTPDFTVMFIPGDHFLGAALKEFPDLFEEAIGNRVLLSTPVNFIALCKTVALIWRQKNITENANQISQLGKKLYDYLAQFGGYLRDVGSNLGKTVKSYNSAATILESKIFSSARKFKELGVTTKGEIGEVPQSDTHPKLPQIDE